MKKAWIALALVAVLAALGYRTLGGSTPAPAFTATSIKGQTLDSGRLQGKMLLVNFWATSCPGCVEEMPQIAKLHQDYAPRGLQIVAVAMSYDPPNYVQSFVDKYQLPFFVTLDSQGAIAKSFGDVQLTPTTVLIDKQGNIVKRYVGVMDFAEVRKLIEQGLAS